MPCFMNNKLSFLDVIWWLGHAQVPMQVHTNTHAHTRAHARTHACMHARAVQGPVCGAMVPLQSTEIGFCSAHNWCFTRWKTCAPCLCPSLAKDPVNWRVERQMFTLFPTTFQPGWTLLVKLSDLGGRTESFWRDEGGSTIKADYLEDMA